MSRLASLDGLRAVAISLVVGFHLTNNDGFPAGHRMIWESLVNGGLGVRLFLVLSGFLITHLLLREELNYSRISLKNFFIRRMLRIFPVYFAVLLALFVLTRTTALSIPLRGWLADLTFTRDFTFYQSVDSHLWSLAVEEQFYLFWPLCILYFGVRGRVGSTLLLIGLAPVARVAFYAAGLGNFAEFSFFANMDSLMTGCLASLLMQHRGEMIGGYLDRHCFACRSVTIVLVYAVCFLQRNGMLGKLTVPFGPSLQNFCLVLFMLSVTTVRRGVWFRVLNTRFIAWIGILSYSIYIWQKLFAVKQGFYTEQPIFWLNFPWVVVPLFLTAALSYYALEMPFMKLRALFRAKALPAAVTREPCGEAAAL